MNKGDILIIYTQPNYSDSKIFWVYDRFLLISFDWSGMQIFHISEIDKIDGKKKIVSPKNELSWTKKKKLNETLSLIISKETVLSFKERNNFLKYICWTFSSELNIHLTDSPSYISVNSLLKSQRVYIRTYYGSHKNETELECQPS